MEFKKRLIYGKTDSSVSMVFPPSVRNHSRFTGEAFQLTFSCNFDFSAFPFDSHECPIKYGDAVFGQGLMRFNETRAVFGNISTKTGGDPIILDNLPIPFEIHLVSLPTFEVTNIDMDTFSYTGIVLKMTRKSPGVLSGYFYPTAAFALLSMISFLIKPDIVSSFFTVIKLVLKTFILN